MVQGAGMKCMKFLTIVFNILFLLAGLALLILGAISQAKQSQINHISSAAVLVMVIGGVVFLLAFFGCCGAMKENRCMLMTFGILMIIVLVLSVAAIIVAVVFRNQISNIWQEPLRDSLTVYRPGDITTNLLDWPQVQLKSKCCGVNNSSDWLILNVYYKNITAYPASCCGDSDEKSTTCKHATYTDGCLPIVVQTMERSLLIVGGVVGGVAILMIFGIMFAFCLANAIHKGYNVV